MQKILDDITASLLALPDKGKVATYIPQLALVDPDQFGITVALEDGRIFSAGDRHLYPVLDPECLKSIHPDHGTQ